MSGFSQRRQIIIPPGGSSITQVSHTGDTNETVLATIVVPKLPAGSSWRVTPIFSFTGTAGTKTPRIYYGATGSGVGGTLYWTGNAVSANLSHKAIFNVWNRTTSSQFGGISAITGAGVASTAMVTSAVDTTVPTEITISGQLGNANDTFALEGYLLEVILP